MELILFGGLMWLLKILLIGCWEEGGLEMMRFILVTMLNLKNWGKEKKQQLWLWIITLNLKTNKKWKNGFNCLGLNLVQRIQFQLNVGKKLMEIVIKKHCSGMSRQKLKRCLLLKPNRKNGMNNLKKKRNKKRRKKKSWKRRRNRLKLNALSQLLKISRKS